MNKLIGLSQLVELFIASEKANKAYYACDISDIDDMLTELHNANHAFSVCFEQFKKVNALSNKQACALLHSTVEKEALKNAINSMLQDYCTIKNMHYFYNDADKKSRIEKAITSALNDFNALLNDINNFDDMPQNLIADFKSFQAWLNDLLCNYDVNMEIQDIGFLCRYELPQSGYDCMYLNYDDEKAFLTLY